MDRRRRRATQGGPRAARLRAALALLPAVMLLASASRHGHATEAPPDGVTPLARERMGLDLALGTGTSFGSTIGLQARFVVPARPWLLVAPYVAGGFLFKEASGLGAAPAAGISLSAGRHYRAAVDLGVGPIVLGDLKLHGTTLDTRAILGPQVALGLEIARENGAYFRLTAGVGWAEWPRFIAGETSFVFNLSGGVRAL